MYSFAGSLDMVFDSDGVPPGAVGAAAGFGGFGSPFMPPPPPKIRKEFPETWIWETLNAESRFVNRKSCIGNFLKSNVVYLFTQVIIMKLMFWRHNCIVLYHSACIIFYVSFSLGYSHITRIRILNWQTRCPKICENMLY